MTSLDVLLLGGSGTIGRAAARALLAAGHRVTALVRSTADTAGLPPACTLIRGEVTDPRSLNATFDGAGFDAILSCLASRTGAPADAWAVDHDANQTALQAALRNKVKHFVLLSAICVQKPLLAFQQAKLAFEAELQGAPILWSIVRPTAFFKSLSGQVARVQSGRPFLVFGDGKLTACKPISDDDLGRYLTLCLTDATKQNRILPIGGPGPAISPMDQVKLLEQLTGRAVRVRHVPPALMNGIVGLLSTFGRWSPRLAEKAELARIGRYYGTESMLVWDAAENRYNPDITPEFGNDLLVDHYAAILRGEVSDDRKAHAVF